MIDRLADRHGRQTRRQTDGSADRLASRQTDWHLDRQIGISTDRLASRQMDKQTSSSIDRQTDRQDIDWFVSVLGDEHFLWVGWYVVGWLAPLPRCHGKGLTI
jgi:hypothetical protein